MLCKLILALLEMKRTHSPGSWLQIACASWCHRFLWKPLMCPQVHSQGTARAAPSQAVTSQVLLSLGSHRPWSNLRPKCKPPGSGHSQAQWGSARFCSVFLSQGSNPRNSSPATHSLNSYSGASVGFRKNLGFLLFTLLAFRRGSATTDRTAPGQQQCKTDKGSESHWIHGGARRYTQMG